MLETLARWVYRHRWLTLIVTGAFLVGSLIVLVRGGHLTAGTIRGLEFERTELVVDDVVGQKAQTTFVAVFRARDSALHGGPFRAAMERALEPLRVDPAVLSVVSPRNPGPMNPSALINDAARAGVALVSLDGDLEAALRVYPGVRAHLQSDQLEITCTGRIPFLHDLDATLERDLIRAEAISLPVAIIVLLAVFLTLVAAVVPVLVGGLAVVGGIAIVLLLSHRVDVAQYTINVCSLIGLGVSIDYSLFIVSRYREELAFGRDYPEALAATLSTAGRVVAFSGFAVGTSLVGLFFFRESYLVSMGLGGAIVVALAVLFALTFLPALLAVLGPRIHAGRLPVRHLKRPGLAWHRIAMGVMRRPLWVLVPSLGLLLWMGTPFLHLRVAASDVRVLPRGVEARDGYELLRADFPEQVATRIWIAVQFPSAPALNAARASAVYDLSHRVAELPHVAEVKSLIDPRSPLSRQNYAALLLTPPPTQALRIEMAKRAFSRGNALLVEVVTAESPDSEEARAIVRAIRSERAVADGTLLVGGQTAGDIDATDYIMSRAPRAVGFVVLVTLVVLFMLLGSVLLPLKAVALNLLSICGSFGALVWVFQDGHLFVHDPRPIEPSLPILLFCVLFGLSMDYEMLMLTRMKEQYERTGSNEQAVALGLERSAGIITSAASIMVVVFLAFALARVILIRAVGFGLALAVALDATVVRVLLVPAFMRLMGSANWWAPKPLARLYRRIGIRAHP